MSKLLKNTAYGVVLAACVAGAAPALAQTQLTTNGSFENALAGWSTSGNCNFSTRTSGAFRNLPSPAGPTEGSRYLSVAPNTTFVDCALYQDVAIPAGATATLTFAASESSDTTDAAYTGRVEVRTTGNTVLATPFSLNGAQVGYRGPAPFVAYSADLSAYAGQTVRIAIVTTSGNYCCNETFADNVSVLAAAAPTPVPTLSEWAMILFGAILAGAAALFVQGRRQPA